MKTNLLKLAFILVCFATPLVSRAQFQFQTNGDAITLTSYTGSDASVLIPASTNGYPVTTIGAGTFQGNLTLTDVTVPATVTNIGNGAFLSCPNLTAINFWGDAPATGIAFSDPTIVYYSPGTSGWESGTLGGVLAQPFDDSEYLFYEQNGGIFVSTYLGTDLEVTIPSSFYGLKVTTLSGGIFNHWKGMTSITLPNTVVEISGRTFARCTNLTSMNIPASLVVMGEEAFYECSSLTNITVDPTNPAFSSLDGVLYNKTQTKLARFPEGRGGDVAIPHGPDTIGASAFIGCSKLLTVTVPDSVQNLGRRAFALCTRLQSINLPDSLTAFYGFGIYEIFSDCTSLTNISVTPAHPTYSSVGGALFDKTQQNLLVVPAGSTGTYAIPKGVLAIADGAFLTCSGLTNVFVPNTVTNVGYFAFFSCSKLAGVYFHGNAPATTTAFVDTPATAYYFLGTSGWDAGFGGAPTAQVFDDDYRFYVKDGALSIVGYAGTNLQVTIPSSLYGHTVGSVSATLFGPRNRGVTNVVFPETLTELSGRIFFLCNRLPSVRIPADVVTLGDEVFLRCDGLTHITVDDANPVLSSVDGVLFDKAQTRLLQFPAGRSGSYTIPNGVLEVGSHSFELRSTLTSVIVPSSVTNIGFYAFDLCTNLRAVYFKGDAPTAASFAFSSPTVAYYLPDTIGWGSTLSGVPALLWNPQPTLVAVTDGQFGFHIIGPTNAVIVVEAATNLANAGWSPVATNTLDGGTSYFADPEWISSPSRYYRLRSP